MLAFVVMMICCGYEVSAQTGSPPSLSGVKTQLQAQTATFKQIAGVIIGLALIVALITVVWKLASGAQDAKQYLVGLIIGVIVYALFWAIL